MLDDQSIARYARQIVVPGIGAAGQEKLLAATARVVGSARGCEQAARYLRAAGMRVTDGAAGFDIAIVADVASLDDATLRILARSGRAVCWYELDAQGFRCGVHPNAPLPAVGAHDGAPDREEREERAEHDAAACDAAALACAIVLGLPSDRSLVAFGD